MITFQVERWAEFWPDGQPLFEMEDQELGEHDEGIPFDPDLDRMAALDAAGVLLIQTARDDGILIGYCFWFITPSMQHRTLLCGQQFVWFVRPDYRWAPERVGNKMFDLAVEEMKRRGVQKIFPHHRVINGGDRVAVKMHRIKAKPLEVTYSLWIGE